MYRNACTVTEKFHLVTSYNTTIIALVHDTRITLYQFNQTQYRIISQFSHSEELMIVINPDSIMYITRLLSPIWWIKGEYSYKTSACASSL